LAAGISSAALIAVVIVARTTIERLPAVPYAEVQQTRAPEAPDITFYVSDTRRNCAIAQQAYQQRSKVRSAIATMYFRTRIVGGC